MLSTKFPHWFNQIQQRAFIDKHRCLIVLAGEYSWSLSLIETIKSSPCFIPKATSSQKINQKEDWLIYSDNPKLKANVNKQNYRQKLGSQSHAVVFADGEMNIDALAALSGTIKAGGVLFILLPDKLSLIKQNSNSAFLQRFINKIEHSFSSCIIEQGRDFDQELDLDKYVAKDTSTSYCISELTTANVFPLNCATQEQYQAVQSILKVATGHRDRPLVLTADRGRGKSCALAIASAQLIDTALLPQHIIITAPHFKAVDSFFNQLKSSLPCAQHSNNKIIHEKGIIEFIPVDQLLKQQVKATLLLVDEAAGIPVYLLNNMLQHYHRVVFSSTVHGYEGAGRGFTLKFQNILNKHYKNWHHQAINQPIRWQENDPVEQFIFDVCLLNAQLPALSFTDTLIKEQGVSFKCLSSEVLLANESLLANIFAVLVTAHYQTTPSDLKLLLDNSQLSVLCLFYQDTVISVALLMSEGCRNENDILDVLSSKRRLKDQFLPQSLMTHCGADTAFGFDYLRIMRIAVHPQCQSKGIGTLFLSKISKYAESLQVDFLGSSFGCNKQLLNFWLSSNYQLARIGFNQDAASGEHSALILKALSGKAFKFQSKINKAFYQSFTYLLSDEYRQLSDILVWSIYNYCPNEYLPKLASSDVNAVQEFASKQRLYSSCAYSLHLWLQHQFSAPLDEELLPVLSRLLKRMSVAEVCAIYKLKGKKALNQLILDYVNKQI